MLNKALFTLAILLALPVQADEPETGPVISGFGPTYPVPEGSLNLDPSQEYRIVMDVGQGPDDPAKMNHYIESAARFLNMHARNGIKPENLKMAVVLHGSATRSALNESAHRESFDTANPSQELLQALGATGVQIYVCGQSAAHHGFTADELLPEAYMAVSAMTAHVRLQQEGYRAILF